MNDERLKNPKEFGADYFDELLERIRDIRGSEKRVYMKIKDIFATSMDYDSQCDQAELFYKTVQNKLHYSVHGHTAAELIAERADASKDNITNALETMDEASVTEIKQVLVGALPAILDDKQQSKKVSNILQAMKREDIADVKGTGHAARWYLVEK